MALDGIWWSLFIVFQASSVLLLRWWQAAAKSVGLLGWVNGWVAGMMTWNECDEMNHSRKKSRPTFSTSKSIAHVFHSSISSGFLQRPQRGLGNDPGRTLGGPWGSDGDGHGQWSSIPCMGSHGLFKKGHWINGAKKLMPSLCQAYAKLFKIHLKEVFLMTFNFFRNFSFKHL